MDNKDPMIIKIVQKQQLWMALRKQKPEHERDAHYLLANTKYHVTLKPSKIKHISLLFNYCNVSSLIVKQ